MEVPLGKRKMLMGFHHRRSRWRKDKNNTIPCVIPPDSNNVGTKPTEHAKDKEGTG